MRSIIPIFPVRALPALALSLSLFVTGSARAQAQPGSALFIAGTINYVAVPHTAAFNSLPLTVMAWVNTSVTTGQQGLLNKYTANSLNGWNVFLLNGRVRAWYFVSSTRNVYGGGDGLDGGFIADGRWHHIAFVVDSSGGTLYVDGVAQHSRLWTGAFGSTTTTNEVRLGSYPGGNNGFAGSIFLDEVSVWNASLSVSQVQTVRNGFTTGLESAFRLAYYLCNESSGATTLADSAPLGGSNHGTVVGLSLFSAVSPSPRTLPASAVNFTQATLNGGVIPNRSAITAGFQWGTTTNFENTSAVITLGGPTATSDQLYSLSLTGLTFDTTYRFRAYASNSAGLVLDSGPRTFRSLNPAQTLPASAVRFTSARLHGEVTPLGSGMTTWFEWGPTTNYGNVTPPVNVPGGSNAVPVSADIAGDFQGRTNHFRLVATNATGRANGADLSFDVPAFPGPAGFPPLRSSAYEGSQASFVSFDARAEWDSSVPMTIEGWVYRQDASRFETLVSHGGVAADSYSLGFSPRLRFQRGTNFAEVPNIVPARKWTHVAASYDGAAVRFYIDGAAVGSRALSHTGAGKLRPLVLGDDGGVEIAGQPRNRLMGAMDEVRLWSVARSSGEIRDGLYREVRAEPGLTAVFPRGGRIEEISGLAGTAGSGVTEQVFGMVPRDLVVPRAAIPPNFDGGIDHAGEYLGAEQLVLRYPDEPLVPDAVAYFVHTTNDLFVGVRGTRLPDAGVAYSNSFLGLFLDPAYERPALAGRTQAVVMVSREPVLARRFVLFGDGGGGYSPCAACAPTNALDAANDDCEGEFGPPCSEFRVSRSLLGSFDEFDGVALGHFDYTPFGDAAFEPQDGFSDSPATWLTMSYGEGSANVPRVQWSGRIFAGLTNTAPPKVGHRVTLFAGGTSFEQLTDNNGRFNFDVPLPTGQLIRALIGFSSLNRYRQAVASPANYQPDFIGEDQVLYPALPSNFTGSIRLASVDFFVLPPPPPAAIVSATPASPQCGVVVRQGEAGGPGELVTLAGTNLHAEMEFYLAPVSATFPNSPAAWTLLPVRVVQPPTNGTSVVLEAPFVPEFVRRETNGTFVPSFDPQTQWRWVAHDSWSRPGRLEFSTVGPFAILRGAPYPVVHGFRFGNQGAGGRLHEFLACYGENAYICAGPACVPDPLYWGIWYFVYDYWIGESGGSCVGMAGTAAQIFNGYRRAVDFDPLAFTANGIQDSPPFFPGEYDTSNFGGSATRPPVPKDVWAVIRANHGAQTSLEYLTHGLGQLKSISGFSGFPGARLNQVRTRTGEYTICMQLTDGRGHCVSPYRVEDNFNGDPNRSRIWIYDNEKPCTPPASPSSSCVNNAFIDVDLSADTFTFGSFTGDGMFAIPVDIYNGRRTAPIVLLGAAFELPQLLMFIAGGADAHYSSPQGEWGWRPDGTFVDDFPGLRAIVPLGSTANRTRSIPVFLSHSNNLSHADLTVQMNVRAAHSNFFHVSANGVSLQLESLQGVPGHRHRITLGVHSNQLASFRFTPQAAHSNFIPRVGFQIHSNASTVFQWLGLSGDGGRAQEFRALKDRRAVEYCNETTRPTTHYLRIDAVDGSTSNNACARFGPFTVPTGAVHCVVLHDWPRAKQVRSELDLNADGTPDQVTIVTGTEIDSDGDGLPDAWETLRQLNPFAADGDDGADADPDRDGVTNLGEYLTDTDPRDPASVLRLQGTILPDNRVRLFWSAVPGRRYEILYADDLWQAFRPLPNAGFPRTATSTTEQFEQTLPAGATRFYQLRLVP